MDSSAQALIAARPLSLRYSLLALVARLPQIASIQSVEDMRSLRTLVSVGQPRLVVLDANLLGDESGDVLAQIEADAPGTCVVVLVDYIQQQQDLQGKAIDLILLKGHPAADLFARLEQLLAEGKRQGN